MLQGKMFVKLSVVNWLNKFVIKKILRFAQDDSGEANHVLIVILSETKNLIYRSFDILNFYKN